MSSAAARMRLMRERKRVPLTIEVQIDRRERMTQMCRLMSAFGGKADMPVCTANVRF